jgi:hypothetical protein
MSPFNTTENPNEEEWELAHALRSDGFPYDRIGYLDCLGTNWMALQSEDLILP